MSRILLADDSPHAQRMGERLLRDEGHEVVTLADGDSVFARLGDIDPDALILDANLPLRSGYEIAAFVKKSSFYSHAAVLLAGSMAEPVDTAKATTCGADASVQKPFDATLLSVLTPLLTKAESARLQRPAGPPPPPPGEEPVFTSGATAPAPEPEFAAPEEESQPSAPVFVVSTETPLGHTPQALPREEMVRAAVTVALHAAMPSLIEELTKQVLRALDKK